MLTAVRSSRVATIILYNFFTSWRTRVWKVIWVLWKNNWGTQVHLTHYWSQQQSWTQEWPLRLLKVAQPEDQQYQFGKGSSSSSAWSHWDFPGEIERLLPLTHESCCSSLTKVLPVGDLFGGVGAPNTHTHPPVIAWSQGRVDSAPGRNWIWF